MIDTKPRRLNAKQIEGLQALARQIINIMDERLRIDTLEKVASQVKLQNAKLEQLIDTQRRIVSILGHDTRGPLFYVNWMIKSIKDHKVKESEMDSYFQMINNQLDATLIMIEELLDWSKTNVLNNSADKVPFAVKEMVDEIMEPLKDMTIKKGIVLNNDVPENLIGLRHERVVKFIVRNLLMNALKFTKRGIVKITASRNNNWLMLEIMDTGIGMSQEQINHFFAGAVVSTNGTDNEEGTGLGMILINEFLQQINGQLNVSSMVNKGSVLSLKIPMK